MMPTMMEKVVVLPAPLGPRRPTPSPPATSTVTSRSTGRFPYDLHNPSPRSTGLPLTEFSLPFSPPLVFVKLSSRLAVFLRPLPRRYASHRETLSPFLRSPDFRPPATPHSHLRLPYG